MKLHYYYLVNNKREINRVDQVLKGHRIPKDLQDEVETEDQQILQIWQLAVGSPLTKEDLSTLRATQGVITVATSDEFYGLFKFFSKSDK